MVSVVEEGWLLEVSSSEDVAMEVSHAHEQRELLEMAAGISIEVKQQES